MLFNSIEFVIFLPIVFILYWFLSKKIKTQNFILLLASYVFYGWWDYRFLFLLAFSTFLDYFTGLKIHQSDNDRMRKTWLWISVVVNLGFLGFFKYYNFFVDSFSTMLSTVGITTNTWTLSIILPVGISFYTFHGLSYVFDVYNRKFTPIKSFVDYSVFVSFFPLLVAGPIERATHLLPQVQAPRKFDYGKAADGLRQILWGVIKKMVIADNCATYANMIFDDPEKYNGSTLVLGALFFAFQIYGDFSGYSDIALGTARLFGFELLRNFAFPYFSRDIAEFWRRWHISLSSWFRDYLYFPLGGSRGGTWMSVRNTFIIFLVSGFWHGANWTFLAWGTLHAIFYLPLLLSNRNRSHLEIVAQGRMLPSPREFINIILTFGLTTFAWIFFRAESIGDAFVYVREIFSLSIFEKPQLPMKAVTAVILVSGFLIVEWIGREEQYAIAKLGLSWPRPFRWAFYYFLIFVLGMFMQTSETPFIYFQF